MRPLVIDGVGTIVARELDGKLKYVEDKVTKVGLQLQFDWQGVMGGDSGYAFHYTAGDLQDKVTVEVPRYSPAIADMSQGGTTTRSENVLFEGNEYGLLGANGYTVKDSAKYEGEFVADSDEVYLKDPVTDELKALKRVATAPTDEQYTITADGKINSSEANKGKEIFVTFNWTKAGVETAFDGTRRPTPFKLTHRFELIDDKTGKKVPVQLTIYKALGGGTLDISQERKKANVTTMDVQVMEPDRTSDNPEGHAMTIKFGI
ncbi:hypothetical protein FFV09_22860 [Saccharibacillus brassicae]|uniref:Uncharacterized protein n=2 Tax=Saccharibacillus brassicae TaxID=2583377 RepID=A0A4Y6V5X6_SACBS|nr:hypothetical protein FFV09_22860 [Saccharibacillus brassicae]